MIAARLLHIDFWADLPIYKRAAKATLTCLLGCSLGDFGTVIAFQTLRPQTSFAVIMPVAMCMGIVTSMVLETCLLKIKEGLSWSQSVRTAWSMSLLSMLAMELAENATDYLLTQGQVSPTETFYWIALALSLAAGFVAPLPYNYYKLKKYGKSCHG